MGLKGKAPVFGRGFFDFYIQYSELEGANRQLDVVDLFWFMWVGGLTRILGIRFVDFFGEEIATDRGYGDVT